ncbi:glycoside hydrolase family 13 protein [Georgenia sp. Z1491]|uniref:glycoside hydrolase family 13 protein n=1 Tax=Georgenia sp. Z1491 TaxID=3416707 RepID=UPI003CFAAB4E
MTDAAAPHDRPAGTLLHAAGSGGGDHWWRDAVVYQVYPRSFADSDGDGMGDLPGITARLQHLADLGVDAIWLSPFYRSPQKDAGYDVADYRDVDPVLGSLDDAEILLVRAHELGLRVIVDLVPNHTSDQHSWFRAALAAGPGSPERDRYLFRDGRGDDGDLPPNDWTSVFGGIAWTRVRDRTDAPGSAWANDPQWYLHLFDGSQPDLDWDHPEVRAEFLSILRFWLDRGVDGFRVDVAHGLVKEAGLPDWPWHLRMVSGSDVDPADVPPAPMWDRDGVHEIYRTWRRVLDEYSPARILVAEAWVDDDERLARYVRPDEMHQAFNFRFLSTRYDSGSYAAAIRGSLAAADRVGAPSTWVMSNHDVVRHASRLGLAREDTGKGPNGITADDPQPDAALGLRRARAVTLVMLALPGSAYLYQGEELGLPEHTHLPAQARQDPAYARTAGAEAGRDGCRVPLPWEADAPAFGFSPSGASWLPQPEEFRALAADRQAGVAGSTLELYREALRLRRKLGLGRASLELVDAGGPGAVEPIGAAGPGAVEMPASGGAEGTAAGDLDGLDAHGVLALISRGADGREVLVVLVTGGEPVHLPEGWRVVLASQPGAGEDGTVPVDTAVWAVRENSAD